MGWVRAKALWAGVGVALTLLGATPALGQPATGRSPSQARADRLAAMGQAFLAAGDAGSAVGYFRDAIRLDPAHAESYRALGGIYLERGDLSDALEVFHNGVRRRPDHAGLWIGLSESLERRGDLEGAARALRELVDRVPRSVAGHRARADLAQRRGAWSEALASLRAVLDLAATGTEVPPAILTEARERVGALAVLTADVDPVSGAATCEGNSPVRRALGGC